VLSVPSLYLLYTTTLDTTLAELVFFSEKPHTSSIFLFAYSTSRLTFLAVVHGKEDSLFFGIVDVQLFPPVHVFGQVVVVVPSIERWVFSAHDSISRYGRFTCCRTGTGKGRVWY
jgi:hypothetical protein